VTPRAYHVLAGRPMKVLLLSMPDSFEHMYSGAIRMPNGALSSLAGNVDPQHEVAVADLILVQGRVRETVERLVAERPPDVVGLSVMTFQRRTARRIVEIVRRLSPRARIVLGGYDPSLAPEAWTDGTADFVVRGEGELTLRDLLRALETGGRFEKIRGLVWKDGTDYVDNGPRAVNGLENGEIRPPQRSSRVLSGYTFLGRAVDIIETSRGCTYDCSFCSIIEMRGRNFHTFGFERVLDDIRDAIAHGARALFVVDDNITLNVARFEALCRAIVDAGLHRVEYLVQGMTSSIASHADTLAPLMREAGFRYVFLGIENVLEQDLGFLKASAKNATREHGRRTGNATIAAIDALHRHGMYVVGGLIVGNPGDTREAVEANLDFARRYVDWPYIQHPTPYPGTPMTRDLRDRGLIVNERLEEYDGTTAVVRSESLSTDEIEFLRWKRERWMKLRHFPTALFHRPGFVIRHGSAMLAHTFRGSTWRSWVGLEDERAVFDRYRAIRREERESVV
jgi:anaerobic magnesium-protoporphyrin IX monomethyl ester cyclase